MALEATPPSTASDGFLRLAFLPSGNGLSVAILTGGTEKDLTYSFTPSGWDRKFTENVVDDPRLTNIQILHRPGTFDEQITVQYVYTDKSATDIAYTALANSGAGGSTGTITVRQGSVANSTAWTIGQKVDLITFISGKPLPDAPTANGLQTITQSLYLTAPTVRDAVLIA
jgi:hypothetical protein